MKKLLTFGASEKYFYKESLSEEERKHKAQSILKANKFIPLVIEGPLLATHSPNPYMAIALESKLTMTQLIEYIRKTLKLTGKQALFIQIRNKILDNSYTIESAYQNFKDPDGFLYIRVNSENPF